MRVAAGKIMLDFSEDFPYSCCVWTGFHIEILSPQSRSTPKLVQTALFGIGRGRGAEEN